MMKALIDSCSYGKTYASCVEQMYSGEKPREEANIKISTGFEIIKMSCSAVNCTNRPQGSDGSLQFFR